MGCGGACGGNCSCGPDPAKPRRFGLKANDVNIVTAARELMLEDSAGIVVVMREDDYKILADSYMAETERDIAKEPKTRSTGLSECQCSRCK